MCCFDGKIGYSVEMSELRSEKPKAFGSWPSAIFIKLPGTNKHPF